MNGEVLKALKGSIRKWEGIIKGTKTDLGIKNCPLCELFHESGCLGCPVANKVNDCSCDGTPYERWVTHHNDKHSKLSILDTKSGTKCECDECKTIAMEELEFLENLEW